MTRRFDYVSGFVVAAVAFGLLYVFVLSYGVRQCSAAIEGTWVGDAILAWLHLPWVTAPAVMFSVALFVIGGLSGRMLRSAAPVFVALVALAVVVIVTGVSAKAPRDTGSCAWTHVHLSG